MGPAGARKRNEGVNPFHNMLKNEFVNECHSRGLPAGDLLKKELQANLKEHVAGVQRVLALRFHEQKKTMDECGLGLYEVAASEPLRTHQPHLGGTSILPDKDRESPLYGGQRGFVNLQSQT